MNFIQPIRDRFQVMLTGVMRNSGTRILAVMSVSVFVLLLFVIVYSYNNQVNDRSKAELDRLESIVKTTALSIDPEMHRALTKEYTAIDEIRSSEQDTDYETMSGILAAAAKANELTSDMYTLIDTEEGLQFAVTSGATPYFRHLWEDAHEENFQEYHQGATFGPYKDANGKWLSAFAPIKDDNGQTVAILQADLQFDGFIAAARRSIAMNLFFLLCGFAIMMSYMTKTVAKIVKREALLHDRIVEQNETIRNAKEDVIDSIRYAKNIQFATLPDRELMSDIFSKEFFVLFKPRDIVSGDFYWVHKRGNKKYFAVADCTGHGVPGAFMSLIGNTTLTNIMADPKIQTPAQILTKLDEELSIITSSEGHKGKDGMDIALLMHDESTQELIYCGANRPLLHVRGKEMTRVNGCKRAIGGEYRCAPFQDKKLNTQKGDRLYMYSDGYADQFGGERGKKYYTKRLRQLIGDMQDHDMQEQRVLYNYEFHLWKDCQEQVDDVLLAGLEIV